MRVNFRPPVLIALALILAVAYLGLKAWRVHSKPVPSIHSIVVLPLRNVSGNASQQYFTDGMTEKLVSDLGQISALRVVSPSSWINIGKRKKTIPQIGREMGVDGVIDGSVIRDGSQITVQAQLIDARTGRQLWKHDYVRNLASALDVQRQVAREIAEQIRVKVKPMEEARLATARSINSEAQDLYLEGRYFLNRNGESDQNEAIGYLKNAIEKDPSFALAYSGLATAYNTLGHTQSLNYVEAFSKAKTAAEKAIDIDPNLAEGHAALADALVELDWNWTAAGKEFRRALELNSNSSLVHFAYTRYLMKLGRFPEAISEAQRGLQLDPTSLMGYHLLSSCYYGAHQYGNALEEIRKAAQFNLFSPNNWIHWDIGVIYVETGNYQKAIEEFRILGDKPPAVLGHLGNAYARAGQRREASQVLSKLKDYVQKDGLGTYEVALIYTGLGDKDDAFAWLEKAYQVRDKGVTFLKFDPTVDPLRSDPRFLSLLLRVGLANGAQ